MGTSHFRGFDIDYVLRLVKRVHVGSCSSSAPDGLPVVRIASTIPMEGKLGPSFIVIIDLTRSCDNVICACTLHDLVQPSYCCKNTSDVYKTKSMPCVVVVVDDMTRMQ